MNWRTINEILWNRKLICGLVWIGRNPCHCRCPMSQSELQLVYRQQHTEMSCRRLVLTRLCWRQWSLSACGAGLEGDSCMTCRPVSHVSRNADDHHWVSWIVNLRQARNSQQHLHWWRRQQTTAGLKCSVWRPQTCSHADEGHSGETISSVQLYTGTVVVEPAQYQMYPCWPAAECHQQIDDMTAAVRLDQFTDVRYVWNKCWEQ